MSTWLTPAEVAERLGFTEDTIVRWCKADKMPGAVRVNGRWLIEAAEIAGQAPAAPSDAPRMLADVTATVARWAAEKRPGFVPDEVVKVVYVLRAGAGGPVKIGTTHNLSRRIELLQLGNHQPLRLLATMPGDAKIEKSIHRRFRHLHIRGEWFRYGTEIRDFVSELKEKANG